MSNLRLCSEAEFVFLFGRALVPRERAAITDALELMQSRPRRGHKDPTPADMLEGAFGRPTAREMLQRRGHPALWAMRFVAVEFSGRTKRAEEVGRLRARRKGKWVCDCLLWIGC